MARAFALLITVIVGALAASPAAMACGGGGSGGYRKPVRPEHFNHKPSAQGNTSGSNPASNATPTTVQTDGF